MVPGVGGHFRCLMVIKEIKISCGSRGFEGVRLLLAVAIAANCINRYWNQLKPTGSERGSVAIIGVTPAFYTLQVLL